MGVLDATPFEAIHHAFVAAFSDYIVPLSPTREQLDEMLTRRGWKPSLSPGAFDGDRLIGFVLNGTDGPLAYNSGTGVVPEARRAHLGRWLMESSIELLRDAGASSYALEVIRGNDAAHGLYRRLGFRETRDLQCWVYEGAQSEPIALRDPDWERLRDWWDLAPSWQNTTASILRSRSDFQVLGGERGYVVVFPSSGDVPQLAVARDARRRGHGRQLLAAAAHVAGKPLRIMNVDARSGDVASFLERCGAKRTVQQIEMVLEL